MNFDQITTPADLLAAASAGDAAEAARTAYLEAYPATLRPIDVHCYDCGTGPLQPCASSGPVHPSRLDWAARINAIRIAEAELAADATRSIRTRLNAGDSTERIARSLDAQHRAAYLLALGWKSVYCTASAPWRSPDPSDRSRWTMAAATRVAIAAEVKEEAR